VEKGRLQAIPLNAVESSRSVIKRLGKRIALFCYIRPNEPEDSYNCHNQGMPACHGFAVISESRQPAVGGLKA
jgi:hypothetical protein